MKKFLVVAMFALAPMTALASPVPAARIDTVVESRFDPSMGLDIKLVSDTAGDVIKSPTADDITPPTDFDAAAKLIPSIIENFSKGGPYALLGVGALIMVLVFALNTYIFPHFSVPSTLTPWIAIAIGALTGIGAALYTGHSLPAALASGIAAGLAGVGKWEAAGQHAAKMLPASTPPNP